MKQPDSTHSIEVLPEPGVVEVYFHGQCVARSAQALAMHETGYSPVLYIPRSHLTEAHLRPSEHHSYCPYKGEARYLSLQVANQASENAAWFYPEPFPAVAAIAGHVAFYPQRVERIVQQPPPPRADIHSITENAMKTQIHNPGNGPQPASSYAQGLAVTEASHWLLVSGQVGLTPEGELLKGTEAQMRRSFENIAAVLADADMGVENIVKLTVFLVDSADVPLYRSARDAFMQGRQVASTLLVIDALAHPGWKVEIEATAAR